MAQPGISEQLLDGLLADLAADRLTLPRLPDIALRIDALMKQEDVDSRQIAAEIRKDPAMAVQVVRMANNAAYRGAKAVTDLRSAITRMGIVATRNLVRALALKQLFASDFPVLQARLRGVWVRSLEIAATAQLLSARLRLLEPEVALLAGLVHQIGVLPLLRQVERLPPPLPPVESVDLVIERLSRQAGQLMLSSWSFPPPLVIVPGLYAVFEREHAGEPDYVDLINVAILALDQHYEGVNAGVDRSRVPAFAKLGVDPDGRVFEWPGFAPAYDDLLAALTG